MTKYITIEREYGSGGRLVGESLARACNIPCYGKEILELASQMLNIPVYELEKYEEKVPNSLLYSIAMLGKSRMGDYDMMLKEGHLFVAEQKAIRKLALGGSAIFVGHCAWKALATQGQVIRVFIKASLEERKKRIRDVYGIAEDDVENTLRKFDKRRANYYSINTTKKWHDLTSYDIVLDTSRLGIDTCVQALKGVFNSM